MDINSQRMFGEACEAKMSHGGAAGEPGLGTPSKTAIMVAAVAQEVESIIGDINERRATDGVFLNRLRKTLLEQVEVIVHSVEQELYKNFEATNVEIKSEVDALFATLNNIEGLQSDIDNFKSALANFYEDVVNSHRKQ